MKARAQLTKTQNRYKADFDKRIRRVNTKLRPGDFVYLNPTNADEKPGKLEPAAIGPFRVLLNDKRTIYIDRNGLVERVSADRATYCPPPPTRNSVTTTPTDLTSKTTDGPTYVVDRISAHRQNASDQLEFRVHWTGYRQPTWEPRTHIPEELVSRYFASQRRKHAPRLPP